jgi:hypothetical protein
MNAQQRDPSLRNRLLSSKVVSQKTVCVNACLYALMKETLCLMEKYLDTYL